MAQLEPITLSATASYFPSPANVGLFDGKEGAVLIDTGNDADSGRKLLKSLAGSRGLAAAVLTHSNADHAGGAAFIASRTGKPIYAARIEAALCADPLLEPSFIWGAYPPAELRGKFFMAPPCAVQPIPEDGPLSAYPELEGLTPVPLGGHFFSQIGLLTDDGVLFAGDALFGEASIRKHPVFFVYDVAAFLSSLDRILALGPEVALPSHGDPVRGAAALVAANRAAVERVAESVLEACAEAASASGGASPDDVLASVCASFSIDLDWAQYALVGSTVRSYLVWLRNRGELEVGFARGRMGWRRK
ncbi:MAG: hypothetical protein A2Z99_05640 [Treponema sp. GWB1_62_6]|nr:MAG: hypothetical protein A2001_16755 [Treponema sp. GWC1_61_84]OHE70842.1 MAG: hypothetical protein A2Z99_05640 [Treponema sp. GWB1_62_6]OHE74763.1 MAG: hypothetical protein A2413_03405 [Treponema sp. RIFOXYC1_FULL_61_9]HCM28713.1 MBL fold metallo-hydrolase [Treponema sp.]